MPAASEGLAGVRSLLLQWDGVVASKKTSEQLPEQASNEETGKIRGKKRHVEKEVTQMWLSR